ncbi:MAG: lipopolysaccharide heptosyltransferase I [Betaproteobacteria bacterium]|nr:lipopolysaccharide heptosyltransferase I [Betaproteobacteria bacterium]
MAKILLVKTSSLGDVIHNLPVVSDIRAQVPGATIDWVVEEAFAEIPALHPGVRRVIPVAVRRWRRGLLGTAAWRELGALRRGLGAESYDLILDTQGLVKSALIARLARGRRCGYGRDSAREPVASCLYQSGFSVPKELHAVTRNRLLAGRCLGYELPQGLDYGIRATGSPLPGLSLRGGGEHEQRNNGEWRPDGPYVVLLHATSRAQKLWPEANWAALGKHLARRGWAAVLPWGAPEEARRSERLAGLLARAVVPPPMTLAELARLLAGARAAVGVDTGLVHLAAALRIPVVGIYCATNPALTGVLPAGRGRNVGAGDGPPAADAVAAALDEVAGP